MKSTESAKAEEARAEATALLAEYKERLGTLRIRVEPESARVVVDGEEVAPDARAAFRVDPGIHHVVVESGERRTGGQIRVGDGEAKDVVLGVADPPPAPVALPVAPPAPAPRVAPPAPAPPPPEAPVSPLVHVGLGVAATGALVGGITGIMTLGRASSLHDACTAGVCPPDAHLGTAQTLGTVSTISFVAAGAGLALGVGAFVLGPSRAPTRVQAYVAPTGAGLGGTFR